MLETASNNTLEEGYYLLVLSLVVLDHREELSELDLAGLVFVD